MDNNDLFFGDDELPDLKDLSIPSDIPAAAEPPVTGLDVDQVQKVLREMRAQVDAMEAQIARMTEPKSIEEAASGEQPAEFPVFDQPDGIELPADPPAAHSPSDPVVAPLPANGPTFDPVIELPTTPGPAVPGLPDLAPVTPTPDFAAPPTPNATPDFAPVPSTDMPPGFPPAAPAHPAPAVDGPPGFPAPDFAPTDMPPGFPPAVPAHPAPAVDGPPGFSTPDFELPPTEMPSPDLPPVFPAADPVQVPAPATGGPAGFPAPAPVPVEPGPPAPVPEFTTQSPFEALDRQFVDDSTPAPMAPPAVAPAATAGVEQAVPQQAPTSAPVVRVQDVLVAVAQQGGAERAEELRENIVMSELRDAARKKASTDDRTKKNTRKKNARPQFLRVTTEFQANRPLVMSVTSPKGGVGKSTTAANLAAYIAKAAEMSNPPDPVRVLLVDGDVSNGNLALRVARTLTPNMLDLINHMDDLHQKGRQLSDWESDIGPYVLAHPKIQNLDVLAAPENPDIGKNLTQNDLNQLMQAFAAHYQVIIFDTGTQITEHTNCAWMAFSSQVYFMVEPELACLHSTADYAKRARKLNLITPDVCRVVCIRANMEIGDITPQQIVSDLFSYVPPTKTFFVDDFHRDAIEAGNTGEFLTLESAEYAAQLTPIVKAALEAYEQDFG